MNYGYYPGCSLAGSARKLDKGLRKVFEKQGHTLEEIPDWNCCGAFRIIGGHNTDFLLNI